MGSMAGRSEDGHSCKRGYLRPRWSLYRFHGWMVNRSVRIWCWGERGLLVCEITHSSLPKMVCDPVTLVVLPTTRISFHAVGARRPQRLQRALILISAIAESSRHSTLGRTRIQVPTQRGPIIIVEDARTCTSLERDKCLPFRRLYQRL